MGDRGGGGGAAGVAGALGAAAPAAAVAAAGAGGGGGAALPTAATRAACRTAIEAQLADVDWVKPVVLQAFTSIWGTRPSAHQTHKVALAVADRDLCHVGTPAERPASFVVGTTAEFTSLDTLLETDNAGGAVTAQVASYAALSLAMTRVESSNLDVAVLTAIQRKLDEHIVDQ